MKNDRTCPICGGLMIYFSKIYANKKADAYLCLHCGHMDIIEKEFDFIENQKITLFQKLFGY